MTLPFSHPSLACGPVIALIAIPGLLWHRHSVTGCLNKVRWNGWLLSTDVSLFLFLVWRTIRHAGTVSLTFGKLVLASALWNKLTVTGKGLHVSQQWWSPDQDRRLRKKKRQTKHVMEIFSTVVSIHVQIVLHIRKSENNFYLEQAKIMHPALSIFSWDFLVIFGDVSGNSSFPVWFRVSSLFSIFFPLFEFCCLWLFLGQINITECISSVCVCS